MPLRLSTSLFAVVLLVAIAGCGDDETETVTVTTEAEAAEGAGEESADAGAGEEDVAALREAVDSLREEVEGAKDPGEPGTAAPAGFSATGCGSGVYVKASTTSCAFALNVARDFFATPGYRFYSYSPTTGQTYLVRCSRTYPALCKAGSARVVIT